MGLNKIEDRLSRIGTIVEGWCSGGNISRLERDIVLEELRRLYDAVLDVESGEVAADDSTTATQSVEVVAETAAVEAVRDVVDDFDDALDIDALLGLSEDDSADDSADATVETQVEAVEEADAVAAIDEEAVEESTEEIVVAPTVDIAPEPEVITEDSVEEVADIVPEVVVDEPKVESVPEPAVGVVLGGGLFDLDDIPVRSKSSRKMISLYNDVPQRESSAHVVEETPQPEEVEKAFEPVVEPKFEQHAVAPMVAEEQPKRIGDVLAGTVTTLADTMAGDDAPTTPFNRITDLRKAIGLNDKFLMIRDLFAGDALRYENTIDTLNEFDDLDECMIYIVENFRWNPDSEGAKLLVSLLERKLA